MLYLRIPKKRIITNVNLTKSVKIFADEVSENLFATNVYLRCRYIFLVSRYMGHSSVDMTAKYILSVGDAPQEVKEYFEQFK